MSAVNTTQNMVQFVAEATATTAKATVTVTTTTTTTTTTGFVDAPGTLLNLHDVCVVDWDEVYNGHKLVPREYTTWNAINITRVSLCAWIILSHVAIILFVLGKRRLRTNPKNPLIANLAAAHIMLGVFVVPVKQHFVLNPHYVNCDLEVGWTFVADYYQTSVSLFAVVSLVVERFIYVYSEKNQKKILKPALVFLTVILLVAPWLASLVFLLPTYIGAFNAEADLPDTCTFKVNEDYFVAAQVLSFVLPSVGVFLLAPYTGLLDFLRPANCLYESLTPKGESTTVTALISLASIFCEAPYCVTRVLMVTLECNNPYCERFYQFLNIAMWVRIAKAAISPFIWLCYTDIRRAVLCHMPKKKRNDDGEEEDLYREEADLKEMEVESATSYKNLGPDTQESTSSVPLNIYSDPGPSTSAAAN